MNSARRTKQKGAEMVEAALVLFLALFTIMGMIELGIGLMFYQGMTERVRAGVRYAVVKNYDVDTIKNYVAYGNPAGSGSTILGVQPGDVSVCVEAYDDTTDIDVIHVSVQHSPFKLISPLLGGMTLAPNVKVSLPVEAMGCTGSAVAPTCPIALAATCP